MTKASPTPLMEYEKEQGDKLAILRGVIKIKKDEAFVEAGFGSSYHREKMSAMVNAYDVVLYLIDKAIGGKGCRN